MNNLLEIFYIEDDVSIAQAVKEYFEQFGSDLPKEMADQLATLENNLK